MSVQEDNDRRAEDAYQNAQAEVAYRQMGRERGDAQAQSATYCKDCRVVGKDEVLICSLHAQAEATAKELAAWEDVFSGYFGPEGRLVEVADKAVQDLHAELRMARVDKAALLKALEKAENLLKADATLGARAVIQLAIDAARPQGAANEGAVCPECGEQRPDDERVVAGMKCGECAYAGETPAKGGIVSR